MSRVWEKGFIAIWLYDLFPYLLGGHFKNFEEDGRVKPEEYGGYGFHPIAILTQTQGDEFLKSLKELEREQKEQQKKILERSKQKLQKLCKRYGVPYPHNGDGR